MSDQQPTPIVYTVTANADGSLNPKIFIQLNEHLQATAPGFDKVSCYKVYGDNDAASSFVIHKFFKYDNKGQPLYLPGSSDDKLTKTRGFLIDKDALAKLSDINPSNDSKFFLKTVPGQGTPKEMVQVKLAAFDYKNAKWVDVALNIKKP